MYRNLRRPIRLSVSAYGQLSEPITLSIPTAGVIEPRWKKKVEEKTPKILNKSVQGREKEETKNGEGNDWGIDLLFDRET